MATRQLFTERAHILPILLGSHTPDSPERKPNTTSCVNNKQLLSNGTTNAYQVYMFPAVLTTQCFLHDNMSSAQQIECTQDNSPAQTGTFMERGGVTTESPLVLMYRHVLVASQITKIGFSYKHLLSPVYIG